MSSEPNLQKLQAENERLKVEILQLREQGRSEHVELVRYWHQQINNPSFSRQTLSHIQGELVHNLGIQYCNLVVYDQARDHYHYKSSYPASSDSVSEDFITTDQFPYGFEILEAGENLIIEDTQTLPSKQDRENFRAYQQHSVFTIPIMHEGKLVAILDLHNGQSANNLSPSDIALAALAAPLIYQGWQELESSLFQNWLKENSPKLINAKCMTDLEECLASFTIFLDIDGVNLFLYEHDEENPSLNIVFSYPRFENLTPSEKVLPANEFPWAMKIFQQGNNLISEDVASLPEEAKAEKEFILSFGQNSLLMIPLIHAGKPTAILDCHTINRFHQWSKQDILYSQQLLTLIYSAYQRILMEQASDESQETLKLVINNSNVGYSIFNKDMSETFYSENTARMLGYPDDVIITPEWLTSKAKLETLNTGDDAIYNAELFSAGSENHSEIFKLKDIDNKPRWFSINYQPYTYTDQGDIETVLGAYSEITELIIKQESLKKAKKQADAANISKSEFLARMSHEIRTPMNAIMGMAHLIKDSELDNKQLDQVQYIDQAAQNLLGIINDILDFSKIEAGKMELECTDFELDNLLEQSCNIAIFEANNKDLEIIIDIEDGLPNILMGDSLRLHQILTNLLSNAVKFTKQGNICIHVYQVESKNSDIKNNCISLAFSVTDQGIGLSPEQIDNLFKPFSQADGSISRQYGGTGLGLVIVKRLCELMDGNINVSSEIGEGSDFTFTVPLQLSASPTKKSLSQDFKNIHALVIDDNDQAREAITHIALSLQLCVESTNNAEHGIELLRQRQSNSETRFELVFIDYRMPNMDGLAAAEIIKRDKSLNYLPTIIMISACDKQDVMKDDSSQYVDDFLRKPVSPSRLYNCINSNVGTDADQEKGSNFLQDFNLQGLKILLVEDNIVNQKVALGMLKKQGVDVNTVNDGQEAIDIMMDNHQAFDMILMDIEMPKVNGLQATDFIRHTLNKSLPIIAMTAHAMRGDKERCLEAGMNDYINKPIDPNTLYSTIAKYKPQ